MKRLTKQYLHVIGESFHLNMISLNFLFIFHHLNHLSQQYFSPEYPVIYKNQQTESFCWFFFASPTIKNNS